MALRRAAKLLTVAFAVTVIAGAMPIAPKNIQSVSNHAKIFDKDFFIIILLLVLLVTFVTFL
jgi:hypothetical protein